MKLALIPIALLSSTLIAGCDKAGRQDSENVDQNRSALAAAAPSAAVPSATDSSGAPVTDSTQATTGIVDSRPAAQSHHAAIDRPSRPPELPIGHGHTANLTNDASARTARTAREVTVPAGTSLPLELTTALSSDTAHVETPVRARLRNPIRVNGYTAMPAGTVFNGTVTNVEEAGRVKGRASLAFRFTDATVNGVRERVRTDPITFRSEASKGEDAAKIGAGAGIGAAIGAIVGGGKGAVKGGAIGGAAGTGAVLATKGKEVNLAAGTDLTTTLAQPVTVRAR